MKVVETHTYTSKKGMSYNVQGVIPETPEEEADIKAILAYHESEEAAQNSIKRLSKQPVQKENAQFHLTIPPDLRPFFPTKEAVLDALHWIVEHKDLVEGTH